jgi:hypothetical protein
MERRAVTEQSFHQLRFESATSAVTVSGLQVLSTTWKSTDRTASHWKHIISNVIVYRGSFSTIHYLSAFPLSSVIKNRVATMSSK